MPVNQSALLKLEYFWFALTIKITEASRKYVNNISFSYRGPWVDIRYPWPVKISMIFMEVTFDLSVTTGHILPIGHSVLLPLIQTFEYWLPWPVCTDLQFRLTFWRDSGLSDLCPKIYILISMLSANSTAEERGNYTEAWQIRMREVGTSFVWILIMF